MREIKGLDIMFRWLLVLGLCCLFFNTPVEAGHNEPIACPQQPAQTGDTTTTAGSCVTTTSKIGGNSASLANSFTPTDQSAASPSLAITANDCHYSNFAKIVVFVCSITYPITVDTHNAIINLPVQLGAAHRITGFISDDNGVQYYAFSTLGGSNLIFINATGSNISNATFSSRRLEISITYASSS